MSYFHTGICTIIGADMFHGPVRDGKGWYHVAMVIRRNLYVSVTSEEVKETKFIEYRISLIRVAS
jgi:hypothetical protein